MARLRFGDIRDKAFAVFVSDEYQPDGLKSPLLTKGRDGKPCLLIFTNAGVDAGRPVNDISDLTPITLVDLSAYLGH